MPRTGPRTAAGKAIASLNSVRHGVLSAQLVVPGLEREEDWFTLRAAILSDLEPVGAIETALAEQVASIVWRRRRIHRFEAEAIAVAYEQAPADLAKQRAYRNLPPTIQEAESLLALAVSATSLLRQLRMRKVRESDRPERGVCYTLLVAAVGNEVGIGELDGLPSADELAEFDGWTGGLLASALTEIARRDGVDLDALYERTLPRLVASTAEWRGQILAINGELERLRRQRLLPDERVLHSIIRYEAHFERSLYRALHELQALQGRRLGHPIDLARVEVYGLPGV